MVLSETNENNLEPIDSIQITGKTDTLICKICGSAYPSRGKYDPGYCRECEKLFGNKDSIYIGGPLNGQKVGDGIDDS